MKLILGIFQCIAIGYVIQHYLITAARILHLGKRKCHAEWTESLDDLPTVCILVPAHNEQAVLETTLRSLLKIEYPKDRVRIIVVNDHSEDRTQVIAEEFSDQYSHIECVNRYEGSRGKPAALNAVLGTITEDVIVQFDADYCAEPTFLEDVVHPFQDASVGLVMGRVIPANVDETLVTRLLDLERAGGYQVAQQGRSLLGWLPQYGGTAGAIRRQMLLELNGWREDAFAEDTDLTFRGILKGWKTVYLNHARCYEQVPTNWYDRKRQVVRWARGHNECFLRYSLPVFFSPHLPLLAKLDALLLLSVYLSPLLLMASILHLAMEISLGSSGSHQLSFLLIGVLFFGAIGNFSLFYEISIAVRIDGGYRRLRIIPLLICTFLVSVIASIQAAILPLLDVVTRQKSLWIKTPRAGDTRSPANRCWQKWVAIAMVLGGMLGAIIAFIVQSGLGAAAFVFLSVCLLGISFAAAIREGLWPTDWRVLITLDVETQGDQT